MNKTFWRLLLCLAFAAPTAGQPTVPEVDLSRHGVPLESVYFDTFQPAMRAVPLNLAPAWLIEQLRDAIPPIHQPRYEEAGEARWLRPEDSVIGYASGGDAWAYPVRILNYHEIVNDTLDAEPLVVAWCPLCGSGVVFSRRLGARTLTFGNTSALYESDMVMLDYETGSYWWHVAGRAIVGTLTGAALELLPATTTTWGEWRRLHPRTRVLSRDTGAPRDYSRDPFTNYAGALNRGRFAFPVSDAARDGRQAAGPTVLAVRHGTGVRAYPVPARAPRVIKDELGGHPVAVFLSGRGGMAFDARVGMRVLTFDRQGEVVLDRETGSTWDAAGRCVQGPLHGERLQVLPSKASYWFAVVAEEPGIEVYAGP